MTARALLLALALALGALAGCRSQVTVAPPLLPPPAPPAAVTGPAVPEASPTAAPLDPTSLPLVIKRGNPAVKAVALTIDDGPHPTFTPRILEILHTAGVQATFFVVGRLAAAHPELVRAEREAGHQVENHTYDHQELTRLSAENARRQLVRGGQAVEAVLGQPPQFFRPPCGKYDEKITRLARDLGLTTVMWTIHSGDVGQGNAQIVYHNVVDHVTNGAIILMHDGAPATLTAMPNAISTLQQRGYAFQTIEKMAQGLSG